MSSAAGGRWRGVDGGGATVAGGGGGRVHAPRPSGYVYLMACLMECGYVSESKAFLHHQNKSKDSPAVQ